MDAFFRDIVPGNNVAVLGCVCSQATKAIAGVINYWNIPQVTCIEAKGRNKVRGERNW